MTPNAEPEKRCTKCGNRKPVTQFSPRKDSSDGYHSHCKVCRRLERARLAYKINAARRRRYATCELYREHVRERNRRSGSKFRNKRKAHYRDVIRKRRWFVRVEVIKRYGGCCACCGELTPQFLTVDHINGDGHIERQTIGSSELYRRLFKTPERLPGYQILCYNCNLAAGHWGRCPHGNVKPQPSMLDKRRGDATGRSDAPGLIGG